MPGARLTGCPGVTLGLLGPGIPDPRIGTDVRLVGCYPQIRFGGLDSLTCPRQAAELPDHFSILEPRFV